MEQQITKAELRRQLRPGTRMRLINTLMGPVAEDKQHRVVERHAASEMVLKKADGVRSYCSLGPGYTARRSGAVFSVYDPLGRLSAEYEVQQ